MYSNCPMPYRRISAYAIAIALATLTPLGARAQAQAQAQAQTKFQAQAQAQAPDRATYIDAVLRRSDSLRRAREFSLAFSTLARIRPDTAAMTELQRAEFHKVDGDCLYGLDRPTDALHAYRHARALYSLDTALAAETKWVNLHTSIANALVMRGDFAAARDTAALAYRLAGDTARLGVAPSQHALRALSGAAERLGDYDAALAAARQALGIVERVEGPEAKSAAYVHNQLGVAYSRLGRFEEARRSYRRAAELFERHEGPDGKLALAARSNEVAVAGLLGEDEGTIPILTRKLARYRADPASHRLAIVATLEELANAHRRIGEPQIGLRYTEEALALLRAMPEAPPVQELGLLIKRVNSELGLSDTLAAARTLSLAEAKLASLPQVPVVEHVRLLTYRGVYEEMAGTPQRALRAFEQAYTLLRASGPGLDARAPELYPRYVRALISAGRPTAALDTIARTRAALRGAGAPRSARLADDFLAMTYVLESEALLTMGADAQRLARTREALAPFASRGTTLVAGLPSARHQRSIGVGVQSVGPALAALAALALQEYVQSRPPAQGGAEDDLIAKLNLYQEYVSALSSPTSLAGIASARQPEAKALRERLAGYEQLIGEAPATSPMQSALLDSVNRVRARLRAIGGTPSAPSVDALREARRALAPDRLVLTFHRVGGRLFGLAMTRDSCWVQDLGDVAAIAREVHSYAAFCRRPGSGFGESAPALRRGYHLHETLIGWLGAARLARTPRLTVVHSRDFEGVSFASLPAADPFSARDFRDVGWAVERCAFSYARSMRDAFDPGPARQVPPAAVAIVPELDDRSAGLAPLPAAAAEAASLVRVARASLLDGAAATLRGFYEAAARASTIHLASHASANAADPDYSYIVLRDSTGAGASRVFAQALGALPLAADLLFLSACETGDGRVYLGRGVTSLANVFRDAGVATVVNTLWRIDDHQAATIVAAFYERLLTDGLAVDHALAEAQRAHLRDAGSQLLHPYYWASYATTGSIAPLRPPFYVRHRGLLLVAGLAVVAGGLLLRSRRRRRSGTFARA